MSLSEELDKLAHLHRQGILSDAEFAQAKARLLDASRPAGASSASDTFSPTSRTSPSTSPASASASRGPPMASATAA